MNGSSSRQAARWTRGLLGYCRLSRLQLAALINNILGRSSEWCAGNNRGKENLVIPCEHGTPLGTKIVGCGSQ